MLGKTKNPGGQSAPQKNKYLVIALLCLPFVLCLYLIFGGSGEQAPATVGGLISTSRTARRRISRATSRKQWSASR